MGPTARYLLSCLVPCSSLTMRAWINPNGSGVGTKIVFGLLQPERRQVRRDVMPVRHRQRQLHAAPGAPPGPLRPSHTACAAPKGFACPAKVVSSVSITRSAGALPGLPAVALIHPIDGRLGRQQPVRGFGQGRQLVARRNPRKAGVRGFHDHQPLDPRRSLRALLTCGFRHHRAVVATSGPRCRKAVGCLLFQPLGCIRTRHLQPHPQLFLSRYPHACHACGLRPARNSANSSANASIVSAVLARATAYTVFFIVSVARMPVLSPSR